MGFQKCDHYSGINGHVTVNNGNIMVNNGKLVVKLIMIIYQVFMAMGDPQKGWFIKDNPT